jgi:LacI family transcriptional regulator, repressor for deo operon, udp, cdd, tsx, nupC, and nupG
VMPQAKVVAHALLARPDRPTAIFAGSDEMAFGSILAARELGLRTPEDVSVVGIDDHPWSRAFDLTTVRQDAHAQGETAAQMVTDVLAGLRAPIGVHRSPIELLVRGSTARPPAAGRGCTDGVRLPSTA